MQPKSIPSLQSGGLLLPVVVGMKRAKALLLRGGRLEIATLAHNKMQTNQFAYQTAGALLLSRLPVA